MFKECGVPINIGEELEIKINQPIYAKLFAKTRDNDKRIRAFTIWMIKALGPLSQIWEKLIMAQVTADKAKKPLPSWSCNGTEFSCKDLEKLLVMGMRALGCGISLNIQRCKNNIKPFLDRRYQVLCAPNNPVTKLLFGDDVEQRVSEIYKVSQTYKTY